MVIRIQTQRLADGEILLEGQAVKVARLEGEISAVIVAIAVRGADAQTSDNLACAAVGCIGGWCTYQAAGEVESSSAGSVGVIVECLPDGEDILRAEVGSLL